MATTYAQLTMQDGTEKLPYLNGSGHLSVSHQKADHHAKNADCTGTPPAVKQCPWREHRGCQMTGSARKMGNYQRVHEKDLWGPYQCSEVGCGTFSACLYRVAAYQETCKKREANLSSTSCRFPLTNAAESGYTAPPIDINRSSSQPPKERNARTASIHTGLSIVSKAILVHHVARTA
jgi:hypothetical protein